MNEIEKKYCVQIMNKMLMMHLFEPVEFDSSVDKSSKGSSEPTIQYEPIDLNLISYNLQHDQYSSPIEWKKSIENMWLIPLKFYKPGSIYYLFAKEQEEWFDKHYIKIPHNDFENWHIKINKISKEIKRLLHAPPEEVVKPIFFQRDTLENNK